MVAPDLKAARLMELAYAFQSNKGKKTAKDLTLTLQQANYKNIPDLHLFTRAIQSVKVDENSSKPPLLSVSMIASQTEEALRSLFIAGAIQANRCGNFCSIICSI